MDEVQAANLEPKEPDTEVVGRIGKDAKVPLGGSTEEKQILIPSGNGNDMTRDAAVSNICTTSSQQPTHSSRRGSPNPSSGISLHIPENHQNGIFASTQSQEPSTLGTKRKKSAEPADHVGTHASNAIAELPPSKRRAQAKASKGTDEEVTPSRRSARIRSGSNITEEQKPLAREINDEKTSATLSSITMKKPIRGRAAGPRTPTKSDNKRTDDKKDENASYQPKSTKKTTRGDRNSTTASPAFKSRGRHSKTWDPIFVVTDPKSPLAKANLMSILTNPLAWTCLSREQQESLLTLLPPAPKGSIRHDEPIPPLAPPPPSTTASQDQTRLKGEVDKKKSESSPSSSLANIPLHRLQRSSAFQTDVRQFQEDLQDGRLDPAWLAMATCASERRAMGEFDTWKEKEREEFWGMNAKGD